MLTEVANGVMVRRSEFCQSNAVVIRGPDESALLVDPGVDGSDLDDLADDLERLGLVVIAGFSTHPHWDHLLWHPRFGNVPRYGTAPCVAGADRDGDRNRGLAARLAPGAPLHLVGDIAMLPTGSTHVPWGGPDVRVVEHAAHAPGHAALLVEGAGVLLAGDMLSDVEVPLLDADGTDPCGDYLAALDLLATAADGARAVVPGHGGVAFDSEIGTRIAADRRYVRSLHDGTNPADPRVGPQATYGADWLPEAHRHNVRLARR